MVNRLGRIAAILVPLCWLGVANAVGLGQISVQSHLNEPLEATIPLSFSGRETAENTNVRMASLDLFQRAGVDYTAAVSHISLEVDSRGGQAVIEVSSDRAIREPFVSFLLEVNTAGSKLVREYTILLDPRTFAEANEDSGSDGGANRTVGGDSGADRSQASRGSSFSGDSYVVRSGDALYTIAERLRPDGVSANAMMMALFRANPDAFYNNNINSLSRGARLDVPSRSEVDGYSQAQVAEFIREQNSAWQNLRRQSASGAGTELASGARDAAAVGQQDREQGSRSDRLALVPPSGEGDGNSNGDAEELRGELQRAEESLASERLRNEDLDARVDELEDITQRQEEALALRDQELARLREQLAQNQSDNQAAAADSEVADSDDGADASLEDDFADAEDDASPSDDSDFFASGDDESASGDDAADEETETVASDADDEQPADDASASDQASETAQADTKAVPLGLSDEEEEGGLNWLLWAGAGAGLLILIVVLIALVIMRRNRGEDEEAGLFEGGNDETGDAEAMLIDAVTDNPQDPATHYALVRFYYEQSDAGSFVDAAQHMHAEIEAPEENELWHRVEDMGQEIAPEAGLTEAPATAPISRPDSEQQEFDQAAVEASSGDEVQAEHTAEDDWTASSEDDGLAGSDWDSDSSADDEWSLGGEDPLADSSDDDDDDWLSGGTDDDSSEHDPLADPPPAPSASTDKQEDDELDFSLDDFDDSDADSSAASSASTDDDSLDFSSELDDSDDSVDDDALERIADSVDSDYSPAGDDEAASSSEDDSFDLDDSFNADVGNDADKKDDDSDELEFSLDEDETMDSAFDDSSTAAEPVGEPQTDTVEPEQDSKAADEFDVDDVDDDFGDDLDIDLDDDDLFGDDDAVDTKLNLAEAYVEAGQAEDARSMLEEVMTEGNEEQQQRAQGLLDKL